MIKTICAVNEMRNIAHSRLNLQVDKVAVILTSPRSGSTLLKSVLASHPEIATLDGEITPFLTLTNNGFGCNSDSDAINSFSNVDKLADNILDDLTVAAKEMPDPGFLKKKWEKRLLLQFPGVFSEPVAHLDLMASLDEALNEIKTGGVSEELALQEIILTKVFRHMPWRMAYYDGRKNTVGAVCFNEKTKLEEPPFVLPGLYRRQFTEQDAREKTLLFKSPPDVYRVGMYEQLFPNAEINYIHLTRGYAQSVNGLMDGWLSPIGFFSLDCSQIGIQLAIEAYSNVVEFGEKWWKFDLPPNWKEFTRARLEDVCLNQWLSAHQAVLASGVKTQRVTFEEFLLRPGQVIKKITDYLGLSEMQSLPEFRTMMATETPKLKRWEKRKILLENMGTDPKVIAMMAALDYSMDPETWI
ncbi:hypothetical protein ACO0LM_01130 [Undibacterium sp. Di26W]|uniref:hypothetical protein n=1 Tax=Undibacterium sp. Di26W TaxID=3413035 RepID=UPI003BF430A7